MGGELGECCGEVGDIGIVLLGNICWPQCEISILYDIVYSLYL